MVVEIKGTCEYEHCEEPAKYIAAGRTGHVGYYCERHAEMVEEEDCPEYVVTCPNCGCGFGVN